MHTRYYILIISLLILAPLSAQIDMSRLELNPFMRKALARNKLPISHSSGV